MRCDDCKHAVWKRNKVGALHPDKSGKCEYTKGVRVPNAVTWRISTIVKDGVLTIKGGSITRGEDHHVPCPVYGRNT